MRAYSEEYLRVTVGGFVTLQCSIFRPADPDRAAVPALDPAVGQLELHRHVATVLRLDDFGRGREVEHVAVRRHATVVEPGPRRRTRDMGHTYALAHARLVTEATRRVP